ncbi:MAG: hypothetical protein KDA96_04895 [Planctomycetaceae bacterium]|nr:hypothetical protein [Planctomycetaceae bacterium]
MRILLTIPHYFNPADSETRYGASIDDVKSRVNSLTACVNSLHQLFSGPQCVMQIREGKTETANRPRTAIVHVVIGTTAGRHLLDYLPVDRDFYQSRSFDCDPRMLGFECRQVLRDRWGSYDWYGYLEDDLILHDPWFLTKLSWFQSHAGPESVLLPNRFERGTSSLVTRAYVDGDIAAHLTSQWQDVTIVPTINGTVLGQPVRFQRPMNPHSGCWFLTAQQMEEWIGRSDFHDRDTSFIGPLESAASLGLMKAFRIYKPAPESASFLEIEHAGQRFIRQIRRRDAADHT